MRRLIRNRSTNCTYCSLVEIQSITGEVNSVIFLQWFLVPLSQLVGYQIFMFHFLADVVAQFVYKLNSSFVAPNDCYFDKFDENRLRESEMSTQQC